MELEETGTGRLRSNARVLIPDGDSPFALMVAQCLKRGDPSMRVDASYVDPHALSRYSRYVGCCYPLSKHGAADGLCSLLARSEYDLVLPVSGPGTAFIATHRAQIEPLATVALIPALDALEQANDKWLFYLALQKAGVPVPPTVLVDSPLCAEALGKNVPLLLKPRRGSGGQGVAKFANAGEFALRAQEFIGPGNPYIMQLFVEGLDMGRSLLARDGQVLAGTFQRPHRRGFRPTGSLQFRRNQAAEEVADSVVSALRWNGVAHVDLRQETSTGRVVAIEMNARYWSSLMGSMVARVNFPLEHVRASMGGVPLSCQPAKDVSYMKITHWPAHFVRHGTPLSHSNLAFNLSDPLAKVMKWLRPSSSMGIGGA